MHYLNFGRKLSATTRLISLVIIMLILAGQEVALALAPPGDSSSYFGPTHPRQQRTFLKDLRDDFLYLISQRDFYQIIGGVGVAPQIFETHFRNETPEFTERWGMSKFADNFFELGEGMGSAIYPVAAGVLVFALNGKSKNPSLKAFGSDLIRAHLFNGLITVSMKQLVNRTRPDGAPYSYPSGHTSTAFTSAGVIYHHFGQKFGIPAFIFASYIGLSRLQENKHYMSDIVAGAIIGTYISVKISGRNNQENGFELHPAVFAGSPGAGITFKF